MPIDHLHRYIVDETTGCWVWAGHIHKHLGYGHLWVSGKNWLAHRYFYTQLVGPIPPNKQLDHTCRNTACVNPAHIELVSPKENIRRSGRVKLSMNDVNAIRASQEKTTVLAAKYQVSQGYVSRIKTGMRRQVNPTYDEV